MSSEKLVRPMDLDTPIPPQENEFITLKPGVYAFEVTDAPVCILEEQSGKMSPGAKYINLKVRIETEDGNATLSKRFYLVDSYNWLVELFCLSTGMITKGQNATFRMITNSIGRRGVCSVTNYTGKKDGKLYNQVDKFILPESHPLGQALAQPEPQPAHPPVAPPQQTQALPNMQDPPGAEIPF